MMNSQSGMVLSDTRDIGDAGRTPSTRSLYHESDLLVWEAYTEKKRIPGHATLSQVLSIARTANVRKLSAARMRRDFDAAGASIVPQPSAVDMQLRSPRKGFSFARMMCARFPTSMLPISSIARCLLRSLSWIASY